MVVDYSLVTEELEDRTFRMNQLTDLAPTLLPDDSIFMADLKDGYYHIWLLRGDQVPLQFMVEGSIYVPVCLNCDLKVPP